MFLTATNALAYCITDPAFYLYQNYLNGSQEPTRVKHLSGAPLIVWLLALPSNIKLGFKVLPGTNTQLLRKSVNYGCKKFYSTDSLVR
jgi:hypothetical protein